MLTEDVAMSSVTEGPPRAGPQRAALRSRGQFWTPQWVAEAMVAYVLRGGATEVFDPAVGSGAFFRAAKAVAQRLGVNLSLAGTEIDPAALGQARQAGLSDADLADVRIADFLLDPPTRPLAAIVANPPYVRHHRLSPAMKGWVKGFGASLTGRALDGRAGLHVYFLLRALQLLAPGGRLAFILPADVCEGVYADDLWRWVVSGCEVTPELMDRLRAKGRATLLLCPNGRSKEELPEAVRAYLDEGEKAGLPQRAIMKARSPWYRMERRKVPPILFAYLGRRNARFIRNLAGVVPLTCFLCVYPRREDPHFVAALWKVVSHPLTIANLPLVGKSYGSGCIKVEPRSLERLPLPPAVVAEAGLALCSRRRQLQLAL